MPLNFLEYNMVSFIKNLTNLSIYSCVLVQKNQQGINKDDKGTLEPLVDETECCVSHKLAVKRNHGLCGTFSFLNES